jgi:hypothetical protein
MPRPEDPPRPPRELRRIALYHRLVLACVVVQLGIWIGYTVAVSTGLARDNGEGAVLALIWTAGVGLAGGLLVFRLTAESVGPVGGAVLGLLTAVPLLGLFLLTVASNRATAVLRANGVRVGLFGARTSDIREEAAFDPDEYDW